MEKTQHEGHTSLAGEAHSRRVANEGARVAGAEIPRSNFVMGELVRERRGRTR
jgi:hypothetical protein